MSFLTRARRAVDAFLKPPTDKVWSPSEWESIAQPIGWAYTQDDLVRILEEAQSGRLTNLMPLLDEMVSRDSTLKALIDLQGDYLVGSSASVLPWPTEVRKGKAARSQAGRRAQAIRDYVFGELFRPEVRLDRVVRTLWSGYYRSISGVQVIVEPGAGPRVLGRKTERLVEMSEVPAGLFGFDQKTGGTQIDVDGKGTKYRKLSELGSSVFTLITDNGFRNPARRGLMRPLFNLWLVRNLGFAWWSRFVELYGVPFRLAKYPEGNVNARVALDNLLRYSGAAGFAVVPDTVDYSIVDTFQRISGHSPHQGISEYIGREYSKLIAGHAHAIEVQQGTGSVQGSKHGDAILIRKTNARALDIAQTIRDGYVMPAVARNFSIEDALEHTPDIQIFMEQLGELLQTVQAFREAVEMGVETIPVEEFHSATGIRMAADGEPTIRPIPKPGQPTKDAADGTAGAPADSAPSAEGAEGAPAADSDETDSEEMPMTAGESDAADGMSPNRQGGG